MATHTPQFTPRTRQSVLGFCSPSHRFCWSGALSPGSQLSPAQPKPNFCGRPGLQGPFPALPCGVPWPVDSRPLLIPARLFLRTSGPPPPIFSLSADYPGPFLFLLVFKPRLVTVLYNKRSSQLQILASIAVSTASLVACRPSVALVSQPKTFSPPTPWHRHPRLRLISDSPRVFFLARIRKGRITYIRLHTTV